ncbi:hypothetical protein EMIT0P265_50038 [Pseudomonas zeae]
MRLFFVCGFSTPAKNPVMSGVGEYKTRKGNMSGPSLVGFLAPDTLTNALRKQPEVNGNARLSDLHDEGEPLYPPFESRASWSGGTPCLIHFSRLVSPATKLTCTPFWLRTKRGSVSMNWAG